MIAKNKWMALAISLCLGILLSPETSAAAPAITAQPHNQSVASGATVTLSPGVSGTAPLGYQWWKDGSLMLGATSSSLTLAGAQVTNSGAYYLVVTNAAGTAVSLPALVSVGAPTLFAWGGNQGGAFGDGTNNLAVATPLNTSNNAVVLAAGGNFSLYIDASGVLWATGTNSAGTNSIGQLGIDSTVAAANVPFQVATNVVAVAAGWQHSLFVKGDSSLWAMGDNSFGQLGVAAAITNSILPLYVATNVVAVAAGYQHSLFLKADGTVWAMGSNVRGQVGAGALVGSTNQPQLISGGGASLAGGGYHSLFITANGILWGMGNNVEGELGLGVSNSVSLVPAPIATNVISVAAGWQHSLFVKNDGSLWAMGTNSCGQLGLNENLLTGNYVPQQVTLTSNVVAVTAGFNHSLFERADGTLWAMGNDQYGQLGDNENDIPDAYLNAPPSDKVNIVPTPLVAPGLQCASFRSGPAANHSLCTAIQPYLATLFPPTVRIFGGGVQEAGYPFTLESGLTGSAPLSFQWWKNGVLMAGATNASLMVSNASLASSGAYYLVVTNLVGTAISVPVLIKVGSPVLAAWGDNTAGQFGSGTSGFLTNGPVLTTNSAVIMAAGYDSTIYVDGTNDVLWAAGTNGSGQLGDGSYVSTNNPQKILPGNVVAVAAGQAFSLYITNDGTLWGVGDNSAGQLGLGTGILNTNLPVFVATNVAGVAAGFRHSLFIKGDSTLWVMGDNSDGELGLGNYLGASLPVMSASNVVAVTAGAYHSLFIKADGSLWGMGNNTNGQLGLGTSGTTTNLPVLVTTNVIAVAAGFQHTLFIRGDGTLWGMGDNSYGQLGLGSGLTGANLPALIASNVVAVAAGYQHSLFEKADGSLWTMGNNASGQLGDGTFTASYVPEPILTGAFTVTGIASGPAASHTLIAGIALPPTATQPVNQTASSGGTITFSTAATGFGKLSYQWLKNGAMLPGANNNTLALTNAQFNNSGFYSVVVTNGIGMAISVPAMAVVSTPSLFACGDNTEGELGLGTNSPSSLKLPTGTANSAVFAAAGSYYSLFIDAQGVLWGVGANASGQLGLGTNTTFSSLATPIGSNVVATAAGFGTSLFIKNDGTLWGVGANGNYLFGQPSPSATNRPIQLSGFPGKAVAVALGGYHVLALRSDGTLWGAGNDGDGQLGLSVGSYISTWTPVAGGVVSISAGAFHSAFLKADGTLWTMGANQNGEMGNGTITTDQITPILVTNNVIDEVAAYNNTLFVRNDGTLWGMGYNEYGQLGDGTYNDTNRPVLVATNVASVAANQSASLFFKTDGTLWAMGYNGGGAAGLGPNIGQTNQPAQLLAGTPVAGVASGCEAIHTLLVAPPAPPVINQQPANQTLAVGNVAQFTVGAYGFPPLTYQWQFNGTNLNGADVNPLTFLVASNTGGYRVVITNPGGGITSTQAFLSVAAPAGLTGISRLAGNSVKLFCASNSLTIPGRIVAASSLLTPFDAWVTVTNLPAGPVGPVQFIDTTTNYPTRFYRTVWP